MIDVGSLCCPQASAVRIAFSQWARSHTSPLLLQVKTSLVPPPIHFRLSFHVIFMCTIRV